MGSIRAAGKALRAALLSACAAGCVQLLDIERLPIGDASFAGLDGGAADGDASGANPNDGAPAPDGDARAAPRCTTSENVSVCEDFEETVQKCVASGVLRTTLAAVTSAAISPTHVLRVTATPIDGGSATGQCLMKPFFTGPIDSWEMSAWFRPTTLTTETFGLLRATFGRVADAGGSAPTVWLDSVGPTVRIVFFDGLARSEYGEFVAIPGGWTLLALRFDPTTAKLTVLIDGVEKNALPIPVDRIAPGPMQFSAGINGQLTQPHAFDLDDFLVRRWP